MEVNTASSMKTGFNTQEKTLSWRTLDKNAFGEAMLQLGGTTWKKLILLATPISQKTAQNQFTMT